MITVAAKYKWNLRGGIRNILGSSIAFLRNSHVLPVSYKFSLLLLSLLSQQDIKIVCALQYVNAKTLRITFGSILCLR